MGHRYRLERQLGPGSAVCFVLLNPSTADAHSDDPTIRRCAGFARSWGHGRLIVVNLWSRRATRPAELRRMARPGAGASNDRAILQAVDEAQRVIVAWGVHGAWRGRDQQVLRLLQHRELHCLGRTSAGHPRHPLFVPAITAPRTFSRTP
jgi:hypothetical protein